MQEIPARFRTKFIIDDNECWVWQAGKRDGYGRYHHNGQWVQADRYIYELLIGPIPDKLQLDHFKCQNRACVNPAHLEPVPQKVNIERGNSPFILNKRKTHCKRGHEFTSQNVLLDDNGYRRCKICTEAIKRKYHNKTYVRKGNFHASKIHCKNNHEFSKDNTYITKKGTRVCITCKRQYLKQWRANNACNGS